MYWLPDITLFPVNVPSELYIFGEYAAVTAFSAQLDVPYKDPVIPLDTIKEPVTSVLIPIDTLVSSSIILESYK